MKFLIGLVVGAIIAAAIGAGAIAVAFGHLDDVDVGERDKSKDVSQTFDLAGFDRVDIAGVYELEVTVGSDFSVEVSGPADEMERVEASVEKGALVLDQKKRERGKKRFHREGVTAHISMPALTGLDVSGVVDGEVTGVAAEDFAVDLSGVGDIDLSGTCAHLTARVSGVGDLDAEDLQCQSVKISVSGVGDASVYASDAVEASISGMGSIDVFGSPESVQKDGGMFSSITVH